MSIEPFIVGGAMGASAVVGWVARVFKNGNGKAQDSEVVELLRRIAYNTSGMPDIARELRDYMATGRIAMSQIDRLERRLDGPAG